MKSHLSKRSLASIRTGAAVAVTLTLTAVLASGCSDAKIPPLSDSSTVTQTTAPGTAAVPPQQAPAAPQAQSGMPTRLIPNTTAPLTLQSPASIQFDFVADGAGNPIAQVTLTETSPGALREALTALGGAKKGKALVINVSQTVAFLCSAMGPTTQCSARLVHSAGMSVSPETRSFASYELKLAEFSGADAILRRTERAFKMRVTAETGEYVGLVMSVDHGDSMFSIEGGYAQRD